MIKGSNKYCEQTFRDRIHAIDGIRDRLTEDQKIRLSQIKNDFYNKRGTSVSVRQNLTMLENELKDKTKTGIVKRHSQRKNEQVGTLKIQEGLEPFGPKMAYKTVSTYIDSEGMEYYLAEDGRRTYVKLKKIKSDDSILNMK